MDQEFIDEAREGVPMVSKAGKTTLFRFAYFKKRKEPNLKLFRNYTQEGFAESQQQYVKTFLHRKHEMQIKCMRETQTSSFRAISRDQPERSNSKLVKREEAGTVINPNIEVVKPCSPRFTISSERIASPKKAPDSKPECVLMNNRCSFQIRDCIKSLKQHYSNLKIMWTKEEILKLDSKRKATGGLKRNKDARKALMEANIAQESFLEKQSKFFNVLVKDQEDLDFQERNQILEKAQKKTPYVDFSKQIERKDIFNKTISQNNDISYEVDLEAVKKKPLPVPNIMKMTARTDLITKPLSTQSDYNIFNEARLKFDSSIYKSRTNMARDSKRQLFNEFPLDTKLTIEEERLKKAFILTHPRSLSPPGSDFSRKVGREKPSPQQRIEITPLEDFFDTIPVQRGKFGFPPRKIKDRGNTFKGLMKGDPVKKVFSIKKFKAEGTKGHIKHSKSEASSVDNTFRSERNEDLDVTLGRENNYEFKTIVRTEPSEVI